MEGVPVCVRRGVGACGRDCSSGGGVCGPSGLASRDENGVGGFPPKTPALRTAPTPPGSGTGSINRFQPPGSCTHTCVCPRHGAAIRGPLEVQRKAPGQLPRQCADTCHFGPGIRVHGARAGAHLPSQAWRPHPGPKEGAQGQGRPGAWSGVGADPRLCRRETLGGSQGCVAAAPGQAWNPQQRPARWAASGREGGATEQGNQSPWGPG